MLDRLKRSRPVQVFQAYGASNGASYANGLAFTAFLAMFPLILGMLAVAGIIIRDPGAQAKVYDTVASVFPGDAHEQILSALQGVQHSAGLLGVISVVGLLWSGTSLFASMEFALTEIFGTKQRAMLRQRLMGLIMVVVFLAAVLIDVAANSAAAATPSVGSGLLGALVGALVMIGLLVAVYRFVPNRTFAVRDIWPGAVVAGVLIEIFSLAFPLYAKVSHGFNTYGQQFALFFLLATWLSFLCQFILLGAVFNKLRLGTPTEDGIVAEPVGEGKEAKPPADAIEDAKQEAPDGNSDAGTPTPHPAGGAVSAGRMVTPRGPAAAVAGGIVGAVVLALVGRRSRR